MERGLAALPGGVCAPTERCGGTGGSRLWAWTGLLLRLALREQAVSILTMLWHRFNTLPLPVPVPAEVLAGLQRRALEGFWLARHWVLGRC